ncbi:MAG: DUF58 domain-containing protein [Isosphaeraceae bacterium]|nr:DUF58 domain-containing protein [Isosphaeraceae bacterium]
MEASGGLGRLAHWLWRGLWPTQRLVWTREGACYVLVSIGLLLAGYSQQINLILLVAGLTAGPIVASFVASASMLRRLEVSRRAPPYVFAGEPLSIDYTLENERAWTAALALFVEDELTPADRALAGQSAPTPQVFFARVGPRDRARLRWQGISPCRGNYRFRALELITRAPFGLLERRVTVEASAPLIVYPTVGQLTRRWHVIQRQATETQRGQRHDRSAQQQEYHGLRDYRPGDSPRWIHWRTTARLGKPMIKEFEQENEQDLAILLDTWLPRSKVSPVQRDALERAIEFAATVCFETCRRPGRRLLLGWTGATPGVCQGPSSVKLLHELLEQLAVLRPSTEGTFSALLDALPPATLREAALVVVSTRPLNLAEEAERSARLSGGSGRGWAGRVILLDAARGDLDELVQYPGSSSAAVSNRRASDPELIGTLEPEHRAEADERPNGQTPNRTVQPGGRSRP